MRSAAAAVSAAEQRRRAAVGTSPLRAGFALRGVHQRVAYAAEEEDRRQISRIGAGRLALRADGVFSRGGFFRRRRLQRRHDRDGAAVRTNQLRADFPRRGAHQGAAEAAEDGNRRLDAGAGPGEIVVRAEGVFARRPRPCFRVGLRRRNQHAHAAVGTDDLAARLFFGDRQPRAADAASEANASPQRRLVDALGDDVAFLRLAAALRGNDNGGVAQWASHALADSLHQRSSEARCTADNRIRSRDRRVLSPSCATLSTPALTAPLLPRGCWDTPSGALSCNRRRGRACAVRGRR